MRKEKTYYHLINKPGRSYELVRQMLPVLISWAQAHKSPQYYGTLSKTIGHSTARIGYQLGVLGEVFNNLREESGEDVPILNALVINKDSKRPSDGLGAVLAGYDKWDKTKQIQEAERENKRAYSYKKWPWVLKVLGLLPYNDGSEDVVLKKSYNKNTPESPYHKKLKDYVMNHPKEFGIKDVKEWETEHDLLSGDKVDVYFKLANDKRIAVEVKSRISDDSDILRGIYQCVKYKAVLAAELQARGLYADVDAFLVIEKEMSDNNRKTANMLSVKYIVFKKMQ